MSEACYHLTHRSDGKASVRIAVTGAFGFSGKYIAQRLLALRHEVITLTNSPQRANLFGGSIKAFPRTRPANRSSERIPGWRIYGLLEFEAPPSRLSPQTQTSA